MCGGGGGGEGMGRRVMCVWSVLEKKLCEVVCWLKLRLVGSAEDAVAREKVNCGAKRREEI